MLLIFDRHRRRGLVGPDVKRFRSAHRTYLSLVKPRNQDFIRLDQPVVKIAMVRLFKFFASDRSRYLEGSAQSITFQSTDRYFIFEAL